MNPSGQIKVKSEALIKSRVRLFEFGEHEDIVNPGDLMLSMENGAITMEMIIRGRDMFALLAKVETAYKLYEQNRDWLSAPVTTYRKPEIVPPTDRVQANLNAIENYYRQKRLISP